VVFCGDCDQPFDAGTHEEILKGLVSNVYIYELRKALYTQDTYHQFESKVHFDNCDFDGAVAYVDSLLAEVDGRVQRATKAEQDGNVAGRDAEIKRSFFAIGKVLHAVQDFYAHTNYVELSVGQVKKSTDIAVISPWTKAGKDAIKGLRGNGLVSGFVFWGFPQKCSSGTASHADLAKDSESTRSGSVRVTHLENRSQYKIAVQLARDTSQALIDHAFARWPLLKRVNGNSVAFEVMVDRRGL